MDVDRTLEDFNNDPKAFNENLVREFRARGGVLEGPWFGGRLVVLLHHRGARSGVVRVTPLVASGNGEQFVVVASAAGAARHPDWYHNLLAHPRVELEVGTEQFWVRASLAEGAERERLFAAVVADYAEFAGYAERAHPRVLPVFVLERE